MSDIISTSTFAQNQNDTPDIRLVRKPSFSDSKPLNTTTTQRSSGNGTSTHLDTCTNYSRSRTQSPVRCEQRDMNRDLDLRGIGHQADPYPRGSLQIRLPSRPRHHQSSSNHSTIDIDSVKNFSDNSDPPSVESPKDPFMSCEDDPAESSSNELTPAGRDADLESIGEFFTDVPGSGVSTSDESSSGSDISDDGDIDLERFAGDALSEWFGLSIDRFQRPIRVIHAFEQVKEQVEAIARDEGHFILNEEESQESQEEQEDEGSEVEDAGYQPLDVGEANQIPPTAQSQADEATSEGRSSKKRSNNGHLKSEASADIETKGRKPNKKRRVDHRLSCPYRKRNPLRFNVRTHHSCANKAYCDMTVLKKHLGSEHFKPTSFWRTCPRCQQPFDSHELAIFHIRDCPHPPQPQSHALQSDPEDGFNETIETRLRSRKPEFKVEEWKPLYRLLFPNDEIIPEPDFEPVVEDYEVAAKFEDSKNSIRENIDRLAAQHISDQAHRDMLGQAIHKLVVSSIAGFLERQNLCIQGVSVPPRREEASADSLRPSEAPSGQVTRSNDFGYDVDVISEADRVAVRSARHTSYHNSGGGVSRYTGRLSNPPQAPQAGPVYSGMEPSLLPVTAELHADYLGQTRSPFHPTYYTFAMPRPGLTTGTNMRTQSASMSSEDLLLYGQNNVMSNNPYLPMRSQTGSREDMPTDIWTSGLGNGNEGYDGEGWFY